MWFALFVCEGHAGEQAHKLEGRSDVQTIPDHSTHQIFSENLVWNHLFTLDQYVEQQAMSDARIGVFLKILSCICSKINVKHDYYKF